MDNEMDDRQYKEQLDRYITGNYGEDQFKEDKNLETMAKEFWEAWVVKHKEIYPEIWSGSYPIKPPSWEEMNYKIKRCWIAVAQRVINEYLP